MQDQGKRLLLAVALALGVIFVWNTLTHEEPKPKQDAPAKPAPPGPAAPAPTAGTTPVTPGAAPTMAVTDDTPRPPEQTLELKFANVIATFSSYCGGLKSWELTDPRYDHDVMKGALLPEKSRLVTTINGKVAPVPAEQLTNVPECGAFNVNFASSTYVIPRNAVWKGEQVNPTEVRYTYAGNELEVEKRFQIVPEKFSVRMIVTARVRVPDGSVATQQLAVTSYGYQDPATAETGSSYGVAPRAWGSSTMRDGTIVETPVKAVVEWPRYARTLQWTGFEHPYLLVGYSPRTATGEHVEKYTWASDGKNGQPHGFMRTDLLFPAATVKPGDAAMTREVVAYLGPKNYDSLAQADATAGFPTGFNHVVDLGWFAFIGRPLLWLLQTFHATFGNWGIAIVLLTFLVKALTLYWTTKSMRSMKAMAALGPQMKILQQKYGDDKQRQQAETMALYKQHNVNPIAGCLPILLQMPIWLALYRMLSSAGELYQQPLIPGWIDDLTAADPFYILPAVLVVTMFVQARLQPAAVDSRQQKFLQYGMPLMFGVMSFFFPAGLTLYIFTNTVLSALHSIYMNKFDKKSLEIAAQMKQNEAAAAASLSTPATPASSAAKAAAGAARNGGPAKPKRVIDTKATEVAPIQASADTSDDDSAEADDAADGTSSAGARNRPRRKKRRR